MTGAQKILEIDEKMMAGTKTYEDVGLYLAYLYPAILKAEVVALSRSCDSAMNFYGEIERVFPARHWVWNYIFIKD